MSPEYAVFGKFLIKLDVFSFGVVLLEIISGKKNNDSYQKHPSLTLIVHVSNQKKKKTIVTIVIYNVALYG